jgi:hypothetical protein
MVAKPKPLIFNAKVSVPQDTVADQNETPTVAQLQADLQVGLDSDTTLPNGTIVNEVIQINGGT